MSYCTRKLLIALGIATITAVTALAGPEWVELGDAQSLPPGTPVTGQDLKPGDAVTKISGRLGESLPPSPFGDPPPVDLHDMFLLEIVDPTTFYATTIDGYGGSAEFDTRLWLFKMDGTGLLANDDNNDPDLGLTGGCCIVPQSFIGNDATDPDNAQLTEPGLYLLAITTHHSDPESADGPIFDFDFKFPQEISSPDGPGGDLPIAVWEYTPDIFVNGPPAIGGLYEIVFAPDSVASVEGVTTLHMDIKPGGCPNSFNRTSNGVLPVSICGTEDFDVQDIDLDTVVISRADGEGGSTGPNEGPPGPHSTYADNATPFEGEECECHEEEGDGFTDLSLKFKSQDVVDECLLNNLDAGALVRMRVSGELEDGTLFEAFDCIRLVPPGTPPGQASVTSTVKGAWINVSPLDLQLDGGGFASFQRTYPQTTVLTLNAPPVPSHTFMGWKINNSSTLKKGSTLTYTINGNTQTIQAVYQPIVSTQP